MVRLDGPDGLDEPDGEATLPLRNLLLPQRLPFQRLLFWQDLPILTR